ncbi:MAG: lysylphosphatidylglycerol synthase domain-containing protein [Rhodoferax sp.]|nr:lysylphosphatidylglycerol synthase domain-containing protein [Rhodoferax sp.]
MNREQIRSKPGITARVWWPWLKRIAIAAFFMLVASLLVIQGRAIEWGKVSATLANYPLPSLLGAVALALLSLTLYSTFDLLGRYYTGHTLRTPTVMRVTFISYVFNLNLGSLVGGVALRYRLYSRLGLNTGTITRVMSLSMLTNWTGYLLLAGVIFGFHAPALPPGWKIGSAGLQILGFMLLALSLSYLLLCAMSRERSFTLWGHELNLPSLRLAVLQVCMGAANWLLMGGVVFLLLQQKIGFLTVVGVLLVAAVAAIIARVPGGLGVLEAVFVVVLSHQLPKHEVLAALLAYRGIYYLAPLVLAAVLYLVAETRAKKSAPAHR